MSDFKFFQKNKEETLVIPLSNDYVISPTIPVNNVEYCYQFNDDPPIRISVGRSPFTITLTSNVHSNILFRNQDGTTFKLFAREIE